MNSLDDQALIANDLQWHIENLNSKRAKHENQLRKKNYDHRKRRNKVFHRKPATKVNKTFQIFEVKDNDHTLIYIAI